MADAAQRVGRTLVDLRLATGTKPGTRYGPAGAYEVQEASAGFAPAATRYHGVKVAHFWGVKPEPLEALTHQVPEAEW